MKKGEAIKAIDSAVNELEGMPKFKGKQAVINAAKGRLRLLKSLKWDGEEKTVSLLVAETDKELQALSERIKVATKDAI